jgi:hypothetical protein
MNTSTDLLPEIRNLQKLGKFTFGIVPIVAGADKFSNLLTQWSEYLAPGIRSMLPFSPETFMMIVGVIEIIAGILVLTRTKLGASVVAAWLLLIACTLIFSGTYLDVAVRDIVMAIGAYILARLTGILMVADKG